MDCPFWAMLGYALLGIGAATIIIGWPLEGDGREASRGEAWRIIRQRCGL